MFQNVIDEVGDCTLAEKSDHGVPRDAYDDSTLLNFKNNIPDFSMTKIVVIKFCIGETHAR
jgi:hypothetical protein